MRYTRYIELASMLVTLGPLFVAAVIGIHAMDSLWRSLAPKMSQTLIGVYAVAAVITVLSFVRMGIATIRERKRHGYQPRKPSKTKGPHSSGSGHAGTGSPFPVGGGDGGGGFGGGGASGNW